MNVLAAAVAASRQAPAHPCPLPAPPGGQVAAGVPGSLARVHATHLQTITDVDQFFADQPDNAPLVGVLKQTTARSASGWEHAYDYGGPASHNYSSGEYTDVQRPWGWRSLPVRRKARRSARRSAGRSPPASWSMCASGACAARCAAQRSSSADGR
ncbi:MAG: hypothetical protein IPJ94_11190 [Chloroflexi bacterium]|nr:hypothetical protein [Chloroflexota bacterium]